jgi:hypothetical protein
MEHGVWTFVRGDDTLEITREDLEDGITLVIAGDGTPRSYFFRETHRLETFQRDMETLLLKTGWTFQGYEPDRRSGRDRRGWPRRSNDRRRWWTDGIAKRNRTTEQRAAVPSERDSEPHPQPSRTSEKS